MKKLFTFLFASVLFGAAANAQSFTMAHDTVYLNLNYAGEVHNNITNQSASGVTIEWKVIENNFPADWVPGICDNSTCVGGTDIWPPNSPMTDHEATYPGPAGTAGDFKLQVSTTSTPTLGTYVLRARLNNKFAAATDTAIATFIVTKATTGVPAFKNSSDVSLYPNPASSTVNVVYDAAADVKNIAVYNIIGKQVSLFRTTNSGSANLNIENIPSGVYFVRLLNSRGDVVTTRRFTKQ